MLFYHKVQIFHAENVNKIRIRKLQIFSTKSITSSRHNCYMNASLPVLIGSSVNSFLPSSLENPFVLNKCLLFIKEHLYKESSYPYNFLQKDRKNPTEKGSVLVQVLFECMNKDYKTNKMVDAGEFLSSLTLFEDKISKNPFELQLPELSQWPACKHITGRIAKQNRIRAMVSL